ncbi:MAG: DoxX family membrane protein [Ignavibacteriales bacterium]|nr:DoxX family membrane protein [Ignavibacteriales bacterium]
MNKQKTINYIIAITRLYLAVYFILSGLGKINNLEYFANSIENYRLFPLVLINILAITIPWIELISGSLLLLGVFVKENSIIIATLLFLFTIAVFSAVIRNLNIDCGCHGTVDGQKVGLLKIIENVFLFILALVSIKFPSQVMRFVKYF